MRASTIRTALTDANVTNASSAEIQTLDNPKLGLNVIEIQGKIPVDEVNTSVKNALEQDFFVRGGSDGFNSQSVGPTFGAQVARSAVISMHFKRSVDLGLGDPLRGQVRNPCDHRPGPRHPDHRRHLLAHRPRVDQRHRCGLPHHPQVPIYMTR